MSVSAITCVALNFLTELTPIMLSFILFVGLSNATNIVMAVAVNLFPTYYRGMATSFIFRFGRIAGFSGSQLVGVPLANHCPGIFYVNGTFSIGEFRIQFPLFHSIHYFSHEILLIDAKKCFHLQCASSCLQWK